jgi:2-polyprenyl-3-methyl-5-hydroxy-6-metoxy-1,4-benzoquinol methylase
MKKVEGINPAWFERLNTILQLLDKEKNKNILDLGCGNGFVARNLIELGYNVYGVDASLDGINEAKKYYNDRFFILDINENTLPPELENIHFDTIISTEVLEHLYSPEGFILFCKLILNKKSGGELIISTPYHGYFKNLMLALLNQMDNHFTALLEGGHIKFWSIKTLTTLVEKHGFKIDKFVGCGRFPFLWKTMFIKAVL